MNKRPLIILVVGVFLFALGTFFIVQKNENNTMCNQNTGSFNNVVDPDIDKEQLRTELIKFYESCLRKNYENGYLTNTKDGNSESQAYALWQSFWASDKKTFDRVLNWTNDNLKRKNDNLFAWKFEITTGGVTILDENSATDADTDIAHVLLKAGIDWGILDYIDQAKLIMSDIWNIETVPIADNRYVIAGPWANEPASLVINPSYLSPLAYRLFAQFDPTHDWNKVVIDSYSLLERVSNRNDQGLVIPPNWITINKTDASLSDYTVKSDSMDFSYDAFRTFWRVAFDQLENPTAESWNYISSVNLYTTAWETNQEVCNLYKFQNNNYFCDKSTTSTLAAPIAVFSVTNGFLAEQMIKKYLMKEDGLQFPDTDFYAQSWHWFATWLWVKS